MLNYTQDKVMPSLQNTPNLYKKKKNPEFENKAKDLLNFTISDVITNRVIAVDVEKVRF